MAESIPLLTGEEMCSRRFGPRSEQLRRRDNGAERASRCLTYFGGWSGAKDGLLTRGDVKWLCRKAMTSLPKVPVEAPSGKKGFRPGQKVRHPKYGEGTVYQREGDGDEAKLTVQFPRFGLKKLVEKYAQLERA